MKKSLSFLILVFLIGKLQAQCIDPSALGTVNVLANSVDLIWTENGSATQWDIEWGGAGFIQGTGATAFGIATNPFNLSGLLPNVNYCFYVRSICGAALGDTSAWIGPSCFTTPCSPFPAPYFEDVEAHLPTTNLSTSNCWNATSSSSYDWNINGSGSTPTPLTGPVSASSGSNYFYVDASSGASGDEAILISPLIDITSTVPTLEFRYHMFGAQTGILFVDVFNGTTWHIVDSLTGQQQTSGTAAWILRSVDLSAFSGIIQVRFRAVYGNGAQGDISLDNINLLTGPTCPEPSLLNTTNITSSSANFTWVENGTATEWEIEWGPSNFTPGTGTFIVTTTNPFFLTGLNPGISYCSYVRSTCGAGDSSSWAGPYCFTTPCNLSSSYTNVNNGSGNYSFTNTSTGNANQYHWAFGDGNVSTLPSPTHTFATNGIYLVVLTINDSITSCSDYYIDTINVTGVTNPLTCNAGYTISPSTSGINIYNSSTGSNLTYLWDFGDGNTSTLQNPSHTYLISGPFYLCLTIDDGNGCVDQFCDSIGQNGVVFKQTGFTINVSTPIITGVPDNENSLSVVSIYPNPTKGIFNLNLTTTNINKLEIKIMNIHGQVVFSKVKFNNISNVKEEIDLNDKANGVYFITITSNKEVTTRKIIVQ